MRVNCVDSFNFICQNDMPKPGNYTNLGTRKSPSVLPSVTFVIVDDNHNQWLSKKRWMRERPRYMPASSGDSTANSLKYPLLYVAPTGSISVMLRDEVILMNINNVRYA